MRIAVIGTGYLGAVHAACMARLGHHVLGVDTDPDKVAALARGQAPFYEPGLPELLVQGVGSGRLRFTTSIAQAAEFGDVHFLCVGTPQVAGSSAADVSHLDAAVDALVPHLARPCLVVGKSTVPVGTAARLASSIAATSPAGRNVDLAWNPEFLREGNAIQDTLRPDRIVLGVSTPQARDTLLELYAPIVALDIPVVVSDLTTAELVKVAANAFLATKVSFINAMAEVCEATGGDVATLATAIGHDPRIGRRYLHPGLGFGGGCLSKDIRAFLARMTELGVGRAVAFLREVDDINIRRRRTTVDLARELVGGSLAGQRIAVLGASFKPGSDDVRDSPALDVAAAIQREGSHVRVHDPQAVENARASVPGLDYTTDLPKALEGAQLTLHLTEWQEYRSVDPTMLVGLVNAPRVLDARNALDVGRWRDAGWTVRVLGRPLC